MYKDMHGFHSESLHGNLPVFVEIHQCDGFGKPNYKWQRIQRHIQRKPCGITTHLPPVLLRQHHQLKLPHRSTTVQGNDILSSLLAVCGWWGTLLNSCTPNFKSGFYNDLNFKCITLPEAPHSISYQFGPVCGIYELWLIQNTVIQH